MSQPPNPRRITDALDLAGLFGPEADATLGVAEPTLDMWETGELVPTEVQLEHLAQLGGVSMGFFWRPIAPDVAPRGWMCKRSGRGRGCTPLGPKIYPADSAPLTLFSPGDGG